MITCQGNTIYHNHNIFMLTLPYTFPISTENSSSYIQHQLTKNQNHYLQNPIKMESTQIMGAERDDFRLNFEETELRLGLPGGNNEGGEMVAKNNHQGGKRGFAETVDLKLNLATSRDERTIDEEEKEKDGVCEGSSEAISKPPAKAQVVGWPPVRSFRKNIISVQKGNIEKCGGQNAAFVKVSVDGAPYLRKVDLKMYKSYQQLSEALSKMFSSFTIGDCGANGLKDLMNENRLIDLLNGTEYVPTYEDKDGDWMLVGDVPWEMFVNSCKRLRIMKGSEAIGLAPRAVDKCKNRS